MLSVIPFLNKKKTKEKEESSLFFFFFLSNDVMEKSFASALTLQKQEISSNNISSYYRMSK